MCLESNALPPQGEQKNHGGAADGTSEIGATPNTPKEIRIPSNAKSTEDETDCPKRFLEPLFLRRRSSPRNCDGTTETEESSDGDSWSSAEEDRKHKAGGGSAGVVNILLFRSSRLLSNIRGGVILMFHLATKSPHGKATGAEKIATKKASRALKVVLILFILWQLLIVLTCQIVGHMDLILSWIVAMSHVQQEEQVLLDYGITSIPRTRIAFELNRINHHTALREFLLHRAKRTRLLHEQQLQEDVIPRVLLVPDGRELPIRHGPLQRHNYTVVVYEKDREMREVVEETSWLLYQSYKRNNNNLLNLYDRLDMEDQIQLWSLCAVYLHGGIFVGVDSNTDVTTTAATSNLLIDELLFGNEDGLPGLEQHHHAAIMLVADTPEDVPIRLVAAPPRFAMLKCILHRLLKDASEAEAAPTKSGSDLIRNALESSLVTTDSSSLLPQENSSHWRRFYLRNDSKAASCQKENIKSALVSGTSTSRALHGAAGFSEDPSLFVRGVPVRPQQVAPASSREAPSATAVAVVDITETTNASPPPPQPQVPRQKRSRKMFLQSEMRRRRATPSWYCTRCLKWAFYGTYDKCTRACPAAYKELMCSSKSEDSKDLQNVDVQVSVKTAAPGNSPSSTTRIPRIIHQTWFEDITYDRYPQLARLQASWKKKGWDYRFYTDETARQYIVDHFPLRFVEAFDVLIHGAFKADFFRYLVLLKDGGVYADVDVRLETSLDDFITSQMSFFAPLDSPGQYAGQSYCLWNGLLGSSPGHPVMVRAVERVLNYIQERADLYDMEQDTCHHAAAGGNEGSMDVWKIRAEPALFLSGPCGLAVAFNEALMRPPLQSLETGWQAMDDLVVDGTGRDHGDAYILVGDKHDMGRFSFSVPDRNIVVASTDIPDVDKKPHEVRQQQQQLRRGMTEVPTTDEPRIELKQTPHYSDSVDDFRVWGSVNVYKDDWVVNERVFLKVDYQHQQVGLVPDSR